MKTLIALLLVIAAAAITALRRKKGREQLQLLETGQMCVHCRSTNVTRGERGVVCGACGQTTSWALIDQPSLSKKDVDRMNTPDKKGRFWD
jgi:hypothetical protein